MNDSQQRLGVVKNHFTSASKSVPSRKMVLSTHVLNTSSGRPAVGVSVHLYAKGSKDNWIYIGSSQTNSDGRLPTDIIEEELFHPGIYKLQFDTGLYFEQLGVETFYPHVEIVFEVKNPTEHHHVPLLLSPFGYSTYRGS